MFRRTYSRVTDANTLDPARRIFCSIAPPLINTSAIFAKTADAIVLCLDREKWLRNPSIFENSRLYPPPPQR